MPKAKLLLFLASASLLASCGHRVMTSDEINSWYSEHPDQSHVSTEESEPEPSLPSSSDESEPEPSLPSSADESEPEPSLPSSADESEPEPSLPSSSDDSEPEPSLPSSSDDSDDEPEPSGYTVSIAGVSHDLFLNEEAVLVEGQSGEFQATGLNVSKGDALVFSYGESAITSKIGGDVEDEDHKNNMVKSGTDDAPIFTVHNDAENIGIYFKTWDDGGFSFWVEGYVADPEEVDIYSCVVGMNAVTFVDATEELEPTDTAILQLKATGIAAEAGDVLSFTRNAVAIQPGASGTGNNAHRDPTTAVITVVTGGSDLTLYFKVYAPEAPSTENGYDIWLTGYSGGGSSSSELDTIDTKYGLKNIDSGKFLCALEPMQDKDLQGRDQTKALGVHFTAGIKFALCDAETAGQPTWIPAIDGYSFGGTSDTSTNWETYLTAGSGYWEVKTDFDADVYAKFKFEDDKIYFGLAA